MYAGGGMFQLLKWRIGQTVDKSKLSNRLHRTKASLYAKKPWALPRQLNKLEFVE